MEILSINRGTPRKITRNHIERITGIYKGPVSGPVEITPLGLAGDVIADKKNHGGPDQALYLYGQVDYDWWSQTLGEMIKPGLFGENLTISELESARFSIGDKLVIGEVVLQVTAPRIPCGTLSTRIGDPQFVKKFRAAERPGLYCRVLNPGRVAAGDRVVLDPYPGKTVSLLEMTRDHYHPDKTEAGLRRFLNATIDLRTRARKQQLLAQITG
jgi:MOSC domain-containing protein YiiM